MAETNCFYLDASAAIKRYLTETGSPLINALLDAVPPERVMLLTPGVGETVSVLVRRRNSGTISVAAYQEAVGALRAELITTGRIRLWPAEDYLVFQSLPLIEQHSINSTDALVLRSALDMAAILRAAGDNLVLVAAADRRLLRAAAAEGLETLDPETAPLDRLETLIGAA